MYFYELELILFLILILPCLIFAIYAQVKVSSTFNTYSQVESKCGITGEQLVKMIAEKEGIQGIRITRGRGKLTDYYNPSKKTVCLSESTYNSTSVAALGVVAHEMGHAIQHAKGYLPLKLRHLVIRVSNAVSWLYIPLIILGVFMSFVTPTSPVGRVLTWVGVGCFALTTLVSLVTLPVEFNASNRAISTLRELGIMEQEELSQARSVLTAAALTYVAALLMSLAQLLRLIILLRRND